MQKTSAAHALSRFLWCLGFATVPLLVAAYAARAEAYRLQVASIEDKLFLRYVENQGQPFHVEQHILPRLEAMLDQGSWSTRSLLPDREPRPVSLGTAAPGQTVPRIVASTSPTPGQPWSTVTWEGQPGQTMVFQLSSPLIHYQELVTVAVDTDGVLRRLPVYGVPLVGRGQLPAPSLSNTYIATQLERGTFTAWVAQHAASFDGLSIVVGRNHDQKFPDTVYVVLQMPPNATTYKVVMGWRDREELLKGNSLDHGNLNN